MSNIVLSQIHKLSNSLGIDSTPEELRTTLMATAFKSAANESQVGALLIVANQYGLNPWTKEIYAFPDKNNGIVPVVGVDGWSRIINDHPQLDGVEFEYGPAKGAHHEWIECIIYRKDRSRPIRVREFWDEVSRPTGPWSSHGNRMHRHKALIQCARVAFGFVGIFDQDEAERIVEKDITPSKPQQAMREHNLDGFEEYETKHFEALKEQAEYGGMLALTKAFKDLESGPLKTHFWVKHGESLKKAAQETDSKATIVEVQEVPK